MGDDPLQSMSQSAKHKKGSSSSRGGVGGGGGGGKELHRLKSKPIFSEAFQKMTLTI